MSTPTSSICIHGHNQDNNKHAAKHTPTPWHIGRYAPEVVVDVNDHFIATTCPGTSADIAKEDATAARIVACVNACAGIGDPKAALADAREALRKLLRHFKDTDGGCSVSADIALARQTLCALGG